MVAPNPHFPVALAVALRASARFTLLLEDLGKHWRVSPGLLSFASALGANIPNYVASLAAFASGQGQVGLGIIVGSNIFNLAVILGLVTFARQGRQGITLTAAAMHDARRVAALAAAMGVMTLLIYLALTPPALPLPTATVPLLSSVSLGFFVVLIAHAFQRLSHRPHYYYNPAEPRRGPHYPLRRTVTGIIVALALALGGVIVMVASGQAVAADVHLSPVILSLVILAVVTSLPNAIVAYELAHRTRQHGGRRDRKQQRDQCGARQRAAAAAVAAHQARGRSAAAAGYGAAVSAGRGRRRPDAGAPHPARGWRRAAGHLRAVGADSRVRGRVTA